MSIWLRGALILPDRVVEQGLLRLDGDRIAGLQVRMTIVGGEIVFDGR